MTRQFESSGEHRLENDSGPGADSLQRCSLTLVASALREIDEALKCRAVLSFMAIPKTANHFFIRAGIGSFDGLMVQIYPHIAC